MHLGEIGLPLFQTDVGNSRDMLRLEMEGWDERKPALERHSSERVPFGVLGPAVVQPDCLWILEKIEDDGSIKNW